MELESHFPQAVEIKPIVERVCRHFGINPEQLLLKSRGADISNVRSVICYLAVRRSGHSGVEVGRLINLRRAGVSVAAGKGEEMVKHDPVLLKLIDKQTTSVCIQ